MRNRLAIKIMGQTESSSSGAVSEVPTPRRAVSRHVATFRKLYSQLSSSLEEDSPANNDLFRTRFQQHFGGPHLEFGHLLYQQMFGHVTTSVDMETFVTAASDLERICLRGDREKMSSFVFNIFGEEADHLTETGLSDLVRIAATFALLTGSEGGHDHSTVIANDHTLISALLKSAWKMTEREKRELSVKEFNMWVESHCPRLVDGLLHWMMSSLLLIHPEEWEEQGAESHDASNPAATPVTLQATPISHYYRLPTPRRKNGERLSEEKGKELELLIWSLSISLPLVFLGHERDEKSTSKNDYSLGGTWTQLYSSSEHGFSMNRFQHHCSDYREPSVMILDCRPKSPARETRDGGGGGGGEHKFAVAVDTDWKDGTFLWGGEGFRLLQLSPIFLLLSSGPKRISLNEKRRGFPTGLRVMSSPTETTPIFEVDSALETVRFDGVTMTILRVEVWGCGGEKAAERQKKMKEWEKRLILKRRKIKASTIRDEWSNSPDRYILELGGVTTKRPTEQTSQ